MSDLEITDAVVKAHVLLLKTASQVFRYSETRLKPLGITPTQHAVLMTLSVVNPPPTLTVLSKRLLRTKNDLTTVIDNMEKNGLVARQPDENDRRNTRVVNTEKGKALLESMRAKSRELVYDAMSGLSEAELSQLTDILQKIRNHISS